MLTRMRLRRLYLPSRSEPAWHDCSPPLAARKYIVPAVAAQTAPQEHNAGTSVALFRTMMSRFIVLMFALASSASQSNGAFFPESGPTTAGSQATLHGGIALAPAQAPLPVKRAIWAANQLRSRPYRYGGGHRSFHDIGYDCSGTISFALGGAGLISSPMSSLDFCRYGQRGQGRWITVYARNGHTFAVIAGLRLDTTPGESSRYRWAPRWQTSCRGPAGFEARHPLGL
jgi:hypothetical protein